MTNNYKNTCRICLNNNVDELKYEIFLENDGMSYARKINYLTGIQLDRNDDLPKTICLSCCESLVISCDFKSKIFQTDEILKQKNRNENFNDIVTIIPNKNEKKSPLKTKKKPRKSHPVRNKVPHDQDYKCFICNEYFDLISEKDAHVRINHKDDLKICPICSVKKQTSISFESHLRYHRYGYRFLCSTCGKSFRFKNLLENHLRVEHTDTFPYICDLCNYSTKFKINLQRHIKSFHLKIRNFICPNEDCCSQYSTQVGLNLHLYRNHFVEAPVKCPDCHQGFTFDSELRVHKKHCRGLKKGKVTENDLLYDIVENGFACRLCQQIYDTRTKWNIHYHHKHKSSNICNICNKQMASSTSLQKHIRVQHEKIRKFLCEICNKTFGFKHSLESHLNSHTGLKPFSCDLCNFKTGDRSSMSKHRKKCHSSK